ncbi:hypothetical protein C8A05DRAFT_36795, partial [Staphylotrichum tortipilum]
MGHHNPVEYDEVDADADGVEDHLAAVADEEAQLLDNEDYEAYELGDGTSPVPNQHHQNPRPCKKTKTPRWLSFLHGPIPPKNPPFNPLFPALQQLPTKWLRKLLPRTWQRGVLLLLVLALWAASLGIPLVRSKGAAVDATGVPIRHLSCSDAPWTD